MENQQQLKKQQSEQQSDENEEMWNLFEENSFFFTDDESIDEGKEEIDVIINEDKKYIDESIDEKKDVDVNIDEDNEDIDENIAQDKENMDVSAYEDKKDIDEIMAINKEDINMSRDEDKKYSDESKDEKKDIDVNINEDNKGNDKGIAKNEGDIDVIIDENKEDIDVSIDEDKKDMNESIDDKEDIDVNVDEDNEDIDENIVQDKEDMDVSVDEEKKDIDDIMAINKDVIDMSRDEEKKDIDVSVDDKEHIHVNINEDKGDIDEKIVQDKEDMDVSVDEDEKDIDVSIDEHKEDVDENINEHKDVDENIDEHKVDDDENIDEHKEDACENIDEHKEDVDVNIDEYKEDFDVNIDEHKDVDENIDEHKEDVDEKIDEHKEDVDENVDEHKEDVDVNIDEHKDVNENINEYEGVDVHIDEHKDVDENIDEHKEDVCENIAEHKEDVDVNIDEHKDDVDENIDEHKEDVDKRIDELKEDVDENLDERKDNVDENIDEHKDNVDENIDEHKEDVDENIDEFKDVDENIDEHKEDVDENMDADKEDIWNLFEELFPDDSKEKDISDGDKVPQDTNDADIEVQKYRNLNKDESSEADDKCSQEKDIRKTHKELRIELIYEQLRSKNSKKTNKPKLDLNYEESDFMSKYEGWWVKKDAVPKLKKMKIEMNRKIIAARVNPKNRTKVTHKEISIVKRFMNQAKIEENRQLEWELRICEEIKENDNANDMVKFDVFWVKIESADRLNSFRGRLQSEGISDEELKSILQQEIQKERSLLMTGANAEDLPTIFFKTGAIPFSTSQAGKISTTVIQQAGTVMPTETQGTPSFKRPHADDGSENTTAAKQIKLEIPHEKDITTLINEIFTGGTVNIKLKVIFSDIHFQGYECKVEFKGKEFAGNGKSKDAAMLEAANGAVRALMQGEQGQEEISDDETFFKKNLAKLLLNKEHIKEEKGGYFCYLCSVLCVKSLFAHLNDKRHNKKKNENIVMEKNVLGFQNDFEPKIIKENISVSLNDNVKILSEDVVGTKRMVNKKNKKNKKIEYFKKIEILAKYILLNKEYVKEEDGKYCCYLCGQTMFYPGTLLQHVEAKRHRNNFQLAEKEILLNKEYIKEEDGKYCCYLCGQTMFTPSSLLQHVEAKTHRKKARTVSEKPRKPRGTKKKKVKDETMPRRPMSAYFLWLNENREQIKKDNPGAAITEISKKAGELWRALDKTKWEEIQKKLKEEYKNKMKEWKATGGGQKAADEDDNDDDKPEKAKAAKNKTPKKSVGSSPTNAFAGVGFKSAEFIPDDSSDEENGGNDDDDDKKKKTKKPKKEEEEFSSCSEPIVLEALNLGHLKLNTSGEFTCALCDVSSTKSTTVKIHLKGKKHKLKAKEFTEQEIGGSSSPTVFEDIQKGYFIQMSGLPHIATQHDIVEFFSPVDIVSIRFIVASTSEDLSNHIGEADVEFLSQDDATIAMAKHLSIMGDNIILLTLISTSVSSKSLQNPLVSNNPAQLRLVVSDSHDVNMSKGTIIVLKPDHATIILESRDFKKLKDININNNTTEFYVRDTSEYMHQYFVREVGSKEGTATLLNGALITAQGAAQSEYIPLKHGDTIRSGLVTLECHIHTSTFFCFKCDEETTRLQSGPSTSKVKSLSCKSKKRISKVHKDNQKDALEANRRKELKTIRKKYGLTFMYNMEQENVPNDLEYKDRANKRRKIVGSDNPYEKTEVAHTSLAISSKNKGFKMLASMGWKEGEGLGKDNSGMLEPIRGDEVKDNRTGLGGVQMGGGPSLSFKQREKLRDRQKILDITKERFYK